MAELNLYEVPHRNHTAVLKLSDADAESLYGDKATKVGTAKPAEPQPVIRPSHAVDPDDEGEKAAAPRQNKARTAANKTT